MKKHLFFDDNGLFGRDNVVRKHGEPILINQYFDEVCSNDHCTSWVFKTDDGKYRLIYFAHGKDYEGFKMFCAISDDGINFKPEDVSDKAKAPGRIYPHEIMSFEHRNEVATIYEDKYTEDKNERYKLLMTNLIWDELRINDIIYTSADLYNWTLKEGSVWADGAEPLASVFYNKHKGVHTIIERSDWGVRSAGYKETKDWKEFTEYHHCLNVDSDDEALAEIYGMMAFEYHGNYIGLPHMYRGLHSEHNAKFNNGIMDTQLAYSLDGRYWRRSLRQPFITGEGKDPNFKMVWIASQTVLPDQSIMFYGSATLLEHGPAFRNPGTGRIVMYKLRSDGFVFFESENPDTPSYVSTREKVWHGGELHLNINAKYATVALYDSCETEDMGGNNALGISHPLEGYGHEDCIPFSGDSIDWVVKYKNGNTLDSLKNKTLIFEVKFTDGTLYSISGDYTDVFNTQAAKFRKFGILPR